MRCDADRWIDELCEYYHVTPEEAVALGTRSKGRRPSLPGSMTCEPVSNMTLEEIWEQAPRETTEQVFQFYEDMGAWSSFRQCVRHTDLVQFRFSVLQQLRLENGSHFVEYGCGVAPFAWSLLMRMDPANKIKITLNDVSSEHFRFGAWRVNRLIDDRGHVSDVVAAQIQPDRLPTYEKPIDVAVIFEVLEHVPDPVAAIENLLEHASERMTLVENFIDHPNSHGAGPDLESARMKRKAYYDLLDERLTLVHGAHPSSASDATRIWELKK